MTSAFEGLARIGGVPSIDGIPGGFGGLSESDRAWALAGLDELQTRLVITKYSTNLEEIKREKPRFKTAAWVRAHDLIRIHGWGIKVGAMEYQKLCHNVVDKYLDPTARHCKRCAGKGKIFAYAGGKGGIRKPCPVCDGTGERELKGDLGFLSRRKREKYQYRWDQVYDMLSAAESEAAGSMWRKLRW